MNGQTLNWITDLFHHVNDDRVVSLSSKYIHLDYAQSFLMESTKLISNEVIYLKTIQTTELTIFLCKVYI
ncbi:hypothetical protein BLOT_013790 [Blomia tropicalis]|nr:hypothetical protein BLOT_013790 [Blomia tropicalis]